MPSPLEKIQAVETFDFIIVGAGVSGINSAYRVQTEFPHAKFAIFESREDIGGTWDLFKYPGVRSDSDLHTYSFPWHPWPHSNPIVEGPLIVKYLKECMLQYGIDRYVRFKHKVISMNWSSKEQQWTLFIQHDGLVKEYKSRFVVLGTGYYDYETPRQTTIPGIENFKGKVIHPQFWPEEYDYSGQKMAIIGSGATAVTLLPSLVKTAGKVTMVQRSPSYILSMKNNDPGPSWTRKYLRVWYAMVLYLIALACQYFPTYSRKTLLKAAIRQLPASVDVDPHFSPRYKPWDQRLCLSPDGDFFEAFHDPRTNVVTGQIRQVTEHAIEMDDGQIIDADVIITATGLKMMLGGKIDMSVDGRKVQWKDTTVWNGCMISGVPNMFFVIGYTTVSWTIGAEETASIMVRLLKFMAARGAKSATPCVPKDANIGYEKFWDLSSTYSLEAEAQLPKCGKVGPWKPRGQLPVDYVHARWGDITTGLHFSS
ncbi:FAD/NAD(P)-binding domain-containing protein [Hypoxylon sp. FL1857]|nr:FAD/NAD(P)-binding domain-containing protein [Hypoxylon sp. FL1857]